MPWIPRHGASPECDDAEPRGAGCGRGVDVRMRSCRWSAVRVFMPVVLMHVLGLSLGFGVWS